jgi:hypothetical protein
MVYSNFNSNQFEAVQEALIKERFYLEMFLVRALGA